MAVCRNMLLLIPTRENCYRVFHVVYSKGSFEASTEKKMVLVSGLLERITRAHIHTKMNTQKYRRASTRVLVTVWYCTSNMKQDDMSSEEKIHRRETIDQQPITHRQEISKNRFMKLLDFAALFSQFPSSILSWRPPLWFHFIHLALTYEGVLLLSTTHYYCDYYKKLQEQKSSQARSQHDTNRQLASVLQKAAFHFFP